MKQSPEPNESHSNPARTAPEETGSLLAHLWASIASTIILIAICCGLYPLVIWGIAQTVFPNQANGSLVKKDGTPTLKDEEAVGSSLLGQNFSESLPGYFQPRPSAAGNGYDPTSSGGSNLGPLSDKLINGATQAAATQPTTMPADATATTALAPTSSVSSTATPTAPPASQPAETLAFPGLRLRAIHYAVDNNIPFKLYSVASDGTKTPVPLNKFQDGQGNLNDVALVDAFPHPPADASDRTVLIAADFGSPIPADAVTASGSGLDPHISPQNANIQAQRVADTRKISVDKVKALISEHTDQPSLGFLGDPGVNVLMLNLALDTKYPVPASQSPAGAATAASSIPATQPSAK